jgi:hypothetical protein
MAKLLRATLAPPRVMITDKLRSYGAALARMGLRVDHCQHKGLNDRAENSQQPTRRRERIMKRFKSARPRQWFVVIREAYVHGVSTRSVDDLVRAKGGTASLEPGVAPVPGDRRPRQSLPRSPSRRRLTLRLARRVFMQLMDVGRHRAPIARFQRGRSSMLPLTSLEVCRQENPARRQILMLKIAAICRLRRRGGICRRSISHCAVPIRRAKGRRCISPEH